MATDPSVPDQKSDQDNQSEWVVNPDIAWHKLPEMSVTLDTRHFQGQVVHEGPGLLRIKGVNYTWTFDSRVDHGFDHPEVIAIDNHTGTEYQDTIFWDKNGWPKIGNVDLSEEVRAASVREDWPLSIAQHVLDVLYSNRHAHHDPGESIYDSWRDGYPNLWTRRRA